MHCSFKPINQNFKFVWFWYAICNHNFSTSNIQWCIYFRFKIWTENSFMITRFRGNFQYFSKKSVCGKFWQDTCIKLCFCTDSGKMRTGNHCGVTFWFAAFKIDLNTFCKAFHKKNVCIKSNEWYDLSDSKHVRSTATCKKRKLFIKNVRENHALLLWKLRSQLNGFYNQILIFVIKVKGI